MEDTMTYAELKAKGIVSQTGFRPNTFEQWEAGQRLAPEDRVHVVATVREGGGHEIWFTYGNGLRTEPYDLDVTVEAGRPLGSLLFHRYGECQHRVKLYIERLQWK